MLSTSFSALISYLSFSCLANVEAANILCMPLGSYTHINEMTQIVSELPKLGHNVYMLLYKGYKMRSKPEEKGIHIFEYNLPEDAKVINSKYFEQCAINEAFGKGDSWEYDPTVTDEISARDCNNILRDNKLMQLMRQINFDIAIVDGFIFNSCLYIVAYQLNLPVIEMNTEVDMDVSGIPLIPSFTPLPIGLFGAEMTFSERFINTVLFFMKDMLVGYQLGFRNTNKEMLDEFANGKTMDELRRKLAVLFLITRDYLLEWPHPTLPHIVFLGGVTTRTPGPFPDELKTIADRSTQGIIFVSFGSMIGSFPEEVNYKFVAAFTKIKQTVFWRYTGKIDTQGGGVPENVIIRKWFAQRELLAHKNTKIFITHCGNNGNYEGVYFGVPMLAMPIFADQPHNALRIEKKGFGLRLDIMSFTVDELVDAVNELMNNPVYRNKVQKYSAIMRDRIVSPVQEATYWIEHVLKHGGEHLRTHAVDMPWYQYWLVDVFVCLFACFFIIYRILKKVLVFAFRICCRSTKVKPKMK